MLLYNLRLALKSLRRSRVLTALIVSGIALGICVSTTLSTARHTLAKDPFPTRSDRLHYVRLDSWDPERAYPGDAERTLPSQLTFRDVEGLRRSAVPARQSPTFKTMLYVHPEAGGGRPWRETVRLVTSDFFPMFDVPFRFGSGWDRTADAKPEAVAVIDAATNDRLFGGRDSVGRTVRLGERDFRVVGVIDRWQPSTKAYDLTQGAGRFGPPEAVWIPFDLVRPMEIRSAGNNDGWGPSPARGFEGFLASENCWIQMWVELPDEGSRRAYGDFLAAYIAEQKAIGRFQRPPYFKLTRIPELMRELKVVPPEATALMVVSLLFLAVSALNLMGLLLGKFLARSAEVGVRRALGASRLDVFLQHLVECELVGLAGGALGILLSTAGLAGVNRLFPVGGVFELDLPMVALAVGLSLLAGLLAGAYPAWRVCRTPPAMHVKLQ